LIFSGPSDSFAYLKFGVTAGGRSVTLKWSEMPVTYYVTDHGVPGVVPADFRAALGRAFATWEDVPTASISYRFGGFTSALPGEDDGMNTLGFRSAPELDRVLASTSFLVDTATGALLESDIFFNSAFQWSVDPAGQAGRFDLESIALHEIGHMSGLGHSLLGETELQPGGGRRVLAAEAVMFPIAYGSGNILARTPRADDQAGMSDLYPAGEFNRETGSLSGRVTKNGQGIFGAHVVAFNPGEGTLIANFTLDSQGRFSIAGLSPGPHIVRVEPIDDAGLDSFFQSSANTDVDFRAAYYERLVIVPPGGDSGEIQISVQPK
jgi:hypothetical protein